MQGKDPERTPSYFDGDIYIQHNTGIAGDFSDLGAVERSLHAVPGDFGFATIGVKRDAAKAP